MIQEIAWMRWTSKLTQVLWAHKHPKLKRLRQTYGHHVLSNTVPEAEPCVKLIPQNI